MGILYIEKYQTLCRNFGPHICRANGYNSTLNNLGLLFWKQGKYESVEASYQQALAIYRKVVGNNHPHTARTLHNLAILYSEQEKYAQAEPMFQEALAIQQKTLGPDHPFTQPMLRNHALIQQKRRTRVTWWRF